MTTSNDSKFEISVPRDMRSVYWGILAIGGALVFLGYGGDYRYSIAACFLGIVARISQAEHHHREQFERRGERPVIAP